MGAGLDRELVSRLCLEDMQFLLHRFEERAAKSLRAGLLYVGLRAPDVGDERGFHALSHEDDANVEEALRAACKEYWALVKGMRVQPLERHPDPDNWFAIYAGFARRVAAHLGRSSAAEHLGFPNEDAELRAQESDIATFTSMS